MSALIPSGFFAQASHLSLQPAAPPDRYPAIPLDLASEVVGVSHFNLERLKELLEPRPELANAVWDWNFGDWESAIGAASHVGRKDIVDYLIRKGAAPTIFTFAMLGAFEAVKMLIESYPGIESKLGPHGITLLAHAKTGFDLEGANKGSCKQLIGYLEGLGTADGKAYPQLSDDIKKLYLGDYKYGQGINDGFSVRINSRKSVCLGKIGKFGGALNMVGPHKFLYNGAPSVEVSFEVCNEAVVSMTVKEPGLSVTAFKQPG